VPLQLPGAKAAIAVCRDRTGVISFLDPYQSGKILMQTDYTIHTAGVRDIIQLDEWHLASGGYDDTMVVWDIRTCKPVFRGSGSVQCFAKSNPGELFTLAVGQRDGTIKFCGFEASHPKFAALLFFAVSFFSMNPYRLSIAVAQ
jgi:WD40 repeat protein